MTYKSELSSEPYRFDFLDVMRRLEYDNPRKPRVGDSGARDEEIAILGQEPFLEFPASNLGRFDVDRQGRYRVLSRFLGLLGPQGALPLHTTVEAKQWNDMRDESFARFLDLFNHRFIQLFYRAWADSRPAAQHDRPKADRFSGFVGAVIGIGTPPFRNRDSIGDFAKLSVAGLLGPQVKSASRIENLIAHLFKTDVEVEQFVGIWLPLERADQSSLSLNHCSLGRDSLVGASVYSVQDKFRIRIFARDLKQFEAFLPNGEFCEKLADAIYFYLGDLLEYDVEIAIPTRETRPAQLGGFGRLGWTSWMTSKQDPNAKGMRRDCRFHPSERAAQKRQKKSMKQDKERQAWPTSVSRR